MKSWSSRAAIPALAAVLTLGPTSAAAAEQRFGIGLHYWRTIDSLGDLAGIEDDGASLILSYQYLLPGPFKLELDLEVFDDGFAGAPGTALAPQAFVLFGGFLYGGLGVGITYSDDLPDDFSDPFFMARVGLDFKPLPRLHLDLSANYRFDDWEAAKNLDVNTDTLTLGAVVRLAFR